MADSLSDQLTQLQNSVKAKPADDKLRVHLFQLYAQDGKWQKALAQLQVAAQLNPGHNLLAQAYRLALRAELLREDTFKGLRSPNLLGQPPQWTSYLIEALQEDAKGNHEMSSELRSRALDAAPTASGDVDGKPFEWIADVDTRIGPVLEVFVNGDYYWLPFENISEINIEKPVDLRDLVWVPASVKLVNEGMHTMLLPVRYPLVDGTVEDPHLQSRLTTWTQTAEDAWTGHGVKIFATNSHEYSILDIRQIRLNAVSDSGSNQSTGDSNSTSDSTSHSADADH